MERNEEFCTYEQSLDLKELGFDENCFGGYVKLTETQNTFFMNEVISEIDRETPLHRDLIIKTPLKQQILRFFREKYGLYADIFVDDNKTFGFMITYFIEDGRVDKPIQRNFKTYEEVENICIDKLIEIVKNK
jgi:hypothetical protein